MRFRNELEERGLPPLLQAFRDQNLRFIVRPYFREHTQSMMNRMDWPMLTLPLLLPPAAAEHGAGPRSARPPVREKPTSPGAEGSRARKPPKASAKAP